MNLAKTLRRPRITMFGLAVMAMGLLLWARFVISTGHPRTAYAEPMPTPQVAVEAHAGATP